MVGCPVKGFQLKIHRPKKSTAPKKGFVEVVSKKTAREPPTTTIFGNVGINVGVDQYFNPFAWTIDQFLDIAA